MTLLKVISICNTIIHEEHCRDTDLYNPIWKYLCWKNTRTQLQESIKKKMQYMFRCRLLGDGSLKLASNLTWWLMPISVDRFSQSGRQWFLHNCFKKISRISEYKLRERERERESGYSITVSKNFLALANTNWERERETFSLCGNFSIICNHFMCGWCFGRYIWKVQLFTMFFRRLYCSRNIRNVRQILNSDLNKWREISF